jgi:hypothetical protein
MQFENVTFRIIGSGVSITDAALYTEGQDDIGLDNCIFEVGSGNMFNVSGGTSIIGDNCQFGTGASGTISMPTVIFTNIRIGNVNCTIEDASYILLSGYISSGPTLSGITNIIQIQGAANLFGYLLTMATSAAIDYLDISRLRITVETSTVTSLISNLQTLSYINTNGTQISFVSGVTPFDFPQFIQPTIPAVPASGVAQENTNYYPVNVYLYGGTITDIEVTKGTNTYTLFYTTTGIAFSGQVYKLNPGDSITVTYTTAPTWLWLAD